MKLTNMAGVVCGILFLSAVAECRAEPADCKDLRQILAKEQPALVKAAEQSGLIESGLQIKEGLARAASDQAMTQEQVLQLLQDVVLVGLNAGGRDRQSGFIEDEAAFRVLVCAAGSPPRSIANEAVKALLKHGRPTHLSKHAALIRQTLQTKTGDAGAVKLLAMLPMTEEDRQALLKSAGGAAGLAPEVKARLGDLRQEAQLIKAFEAAATFDEKREAAEPLAYVGTTNCCKALILGLNSALVDQAAYEDVALKCHILAALGRVYPEEPLLTTAIRKILDGDDEAFGGWNKVEQYLRDVQTWCRKTFNLQPADILNTGFLHRRKVVKVPLKR